jgi:CSLREA domain-containing protein
MALAALLAVLVSQSNPASAQGTTAVPGTTITVNTIEDESNTDGDCSLREAIEAANTNLGVDGCDAGSATQNRDAIHFALGQKAKIVLSSELPTITDPAGLNINGQKSKITVSGNDQVRVFFVNPGAELTLSRLRVVDGFATSPNPNGAGLFNGGGTVVVKDSTFTGNSVASDIQGALGGAIENNSGTLVVMNSTFSENSSNGAGGAISNNTLATATITNSTFFSNSAGGKGAAVFNFPGGSTTITNSTFSENIVSGSGGGSTIAADSSITLRSTIVANTTQGTNCQGNTTDGGYNIDDDDSCNFSQANNSLPNTEPQLANGLANNGGLTRTIALLTGSPAIDAIPQGDNDCATIIRRDQRGVVRPQGTGCDIGAFEKAVTRR